MANYSILKAAVETVVKTNGNQEITGANLQTTILSIIDSLGAGYQFMGVATPSTTPPSSPDYNIAYIGGAGTYANFGTSYEVPAGNLGVFRYNGSWTVETVEVGKVYDKLISQLELYITEIMGGEFVVDYDNYQLYDNIYDDYQIQVSTTDISLDNAAKYANTGFRNIRIPCENADRIIFTRYDSTGGYGSAFVDGNNTIIRGYATTSSYPQPMDVDVPENAKYFIWSFKPSAGRYCSVVFNRGLINNDAMTGTLTLRRGAITITNQEISMGAAENRLFSAKALNIEDFKSVSVDTDYLVNVIFLNDSLKSIGTSGYVSAFERKRITLAGCKYVLFTVKKSDDTDFAVGDTGGFTVVFEKDVQLNLGDFYLRGVSLPTLFLDSNMVVNGDLLGNRSVWGGSNANKIVHDMTYPSISRSWNASPSYNRIYQSLTLQEGHRYLVGCEARITSVDNAIIESPSNNVLDFNGGTFQNNRAMGIVLNSVPFGLSMVSDGDYTIVVGILDVPVATTYGANVTAYFNLGNGGLNDIMDGYARNAVCVDLTEQTFTKLPTRMELYNAYRRYVEYLRCQPVRWANDKMSTDVAPQFCDSEAKRAFMTEMNAFAKWMGCTQTTLYNPSGVFYEPHKTTCRDYIKVGAAALTENPFLRIINLHSMDVPVIHSDGQSGFIIPTEVAEYSGAAGEASEVLVSSYDIVSAKTGTWNGGTAETRTQALVMVVRSKATGKFIVGYIHNDGSNYSTAWNDNKYAYMKNLFDKVEDESVTLSLGTTTEWSAGYVPLSTQWAKYVDFGTVKNADTTLFAPASTTKYLTCMLALQHMNETESVEYDILDYSTGSGASITAGDVFKLRDAVYLCMASSSNSLANTIARYTGHRLLEEQARHL